ncbi:hypothetical protein NDU88_003679 [Pleurodeles waltl]|uniref:Uncharacterized protein n=1 Tax=Pleurodeles waltl TaxID=8319 RepID=A0AAV7TRU1_PLEWA|nr:hypothetical protein NDU88_003679 [Pleurodeles waltl]
MKEGGGVMGDEYDMLEVQRISKTGVSRYHRSQCGHSPDISSSTCMKLSTSCRMQLCEQEAVHLFVPRKHLHFYMFPGKKRKKKTAVRDGA